MAVDTTTFLGISAFLAVLLTVVNLYNLTIKKPQEIQETNLKETDKALTEFVATYSGQYGEIRTKIESLERHVKDLQKQYADYNARLIKTELLVKIEREGGETE